MVPGATGALPLSHRSVGVEPDGGAVVDVGGGSSQLVDYLVDRGYTNITILDVSPTALGYARRRLGDRADKVKFVEGDVLEHRFDSTVGVWHDRAVFHFLTVSADRERYVTRLSHAIAPGGHVIIATFALDGPEQCSGLPVQRYGPETLAHVLGARFESVDSRSETHITPTGPTQQFLYGHFQSIGNPTN